MKNWQKLKAEEKPKKTALAGIPKSLPSLQRAQRYGEIAAQVGFDWEDPKGVSKKLSEELGELKAALRSQDQDHIREELGDVLFTLAQLSRHLKIDAEGALRESNDKFLGRFEAMEKLAKKKKLVLSDMDTDALEALWQKIK